MSGPVLSLSLRPRGYELDRDATLPPGGWARYLEHARWQAMTGLRSDGRALFERGVVRAQRWRWAPVPVTHGQELTITSWVGRVGRTSLDLVHRVRRAADELLLAFTSATAVRLGDHGPIPFEADVRALLVEGERPEVEALPLEAPLPAGAFVHEHTVVPSDLDLNRHVNQARYVDLLDDARKLAVEGGLLAPRHGGLLKALHLEHAAELPPGATCEVAVFETARGAGALFTRGDGVVAARAHFEAHA